MDSQASTRAEVVERDGGLCIFCGRQGESVHELIPRSSFGKNRKHLAFEVKNRCVVCTTCHAYAHNWVWRERGLRILQKRHGYTYEEPRYRTVLDRT